MWICITLSHFIFTLHPSVRFMFVCAWSSTLYSFFFFFKKTCIDKHRAASVLLLDLYVESYAIKLFRCSGALRHICLTPLQSGTEDCPGWLTVKVMLRSPSNMSFIHPLITLITPSHPGKDHIFFLNVSLSLWLNSIDTWYWRDLAPIMFAWRGLKFVMPMIDDQ